MGKLGMCMANKPTRPTHLWRPCKCMSIFSILFGAFALKLGSSFLINGPTLVIKLQPFHPLWEITGENYIIPYATLRYSKREPHSTPCRRKEKKRAGVRWDTEWHTGPLHHLPFHSIAGESPLDHNCDIKYRKCARKQALS